MPQPRRIPATASRIRPPDPLAGNDERPIYPAQFEAAMAARPDPQERSLYRACRFPVLAARQPCMHRFAGSKLQTRSWATQKFSLADRHELLQPAKRVEHRHQPDQPQQRVTSATSTASMGMGFMSAWRGEDFQPTWYFRDATGATGGQGVFARVVPAGTRCLAFGPDGGFVLCWSELQLRKGSTASGVAVSAFRMRNDVGRSPNGTSSHRVAAGTHAREDPLPAGRSGASRKYHVGESLPPSMLT